jgi:hypothetical protein
MVETRLLDAGRIAHAAKHLVGDNRGGYQLPAVGMRHFGSRDQRRDAIARMPGGDACVAVVEIQIADHRTVHEDSQIETGLLARTKQARRLFARHIGRQLAGNFYGLAVNAQVLAKNLQELIAYVKSRNGNVAFASAGNGGAQHITGEMFRLATGLKLMHVPYKGSAGAVTDVIAGREPMMFDTAITFMPHIKSGRLRAIAIASPKRLAVLPGVPTFSEAGMPGFNSSVWFGLFAPANTPKDIIATLNRETGKVMKQPGWQKLLADTGAEMVDMTPEQFTAFDHAEAVKWAKVVKDSGATIN